MKIDVFCAWGDGPDVGINLTLTEQESVLVRANSATMVFVDLTAAKARLMAAELVACAERAEELDRLCAEHDAYVETGGES